jgi:hypothetical protein
MWRDSNEIGFEGAENDVLRSDRPENVGENWVCYVQALRYVQACRAQASEGFGEMSPGPGASSSVALGFSFGTVVPPPGVPPWLTAGV